MMIDAAVILIVQTIYSATWQRDVVFCLNDEDQYWAYMRLQLQLVARASGAQAIGDSEIAASPLVASLVRSRYPRLD